MPWIIVALAGVSVVFCYSYAFYAKSFFPKEEAELKEGLAVTFANIFLTIWLLLIAINGISEGVSEEELWKIITFIFPILGTFFTLMRVKKGLHF